MTHPDTRKKIQLVEEQADHRVNRMLGKAQRNTFFHSPIPALISEDRS
jgi:hypothetical protein